jgi:hypothetical protein
MYSFMNWMKPDEDSAGSRSITMSMSMSSASSSSRSGNGGGVGGGCVSGGGRASSLGGYLWKLKQGHRIIVPQWNKRWFSIEGKFLRYYEYVNSEEYSGSVDLSTVESVQRVDSVVQGAFSFCISCPDRTYVLRAASNSEVSKWIRAVRSQADLARGGYGMGIIFGASSSGNGTVVAGKGRRDNHGSSVSKSLEHELDLTLERLTQLEKGVLLSADTSSMTASAGTLHLSLDDKKQHANHQTNRFAKDDCSVESLESVEEIKGPGIVGVISARIGDGGYNNYHNSNDSLEDTGTSVRNISRKTREQARGHEQERSSPPKPCSRVNAGKRSGGAKYDFDGSDVERDVGVEVFKSPVIINSASRPTSSTTSTMTMSRPPSADVQDRVLFTVPSRANHPSTAAMSTTSRSKYGHYDVEDDLSGEEFGGRQRIRYSLK